MTVAVASRAPAGALSAILEFAGVTVIAVGYGGGGGGLGAATWTWIEPETVTPFCVAATLH